MQYDVIPRTGHRSQSGYEPVVPLTKAAHTQLSDSHMEGTTTARRHGSKPSLLIAMIQAFGVPFTVAGLLWLISNVLTFVGPLVLK